MAQVSVHVEEVDYVDQGLAGNQCPGCGHGENPGLLAGALQGEILHEGVDLSAAPLEHDEGPQSLVITHVEGDLHGLFPRPGRLGDLELVDLRGLGVGLVEGFAEEAADGGHPGVGGREADRASGGGLAIEHLPEVVVAPHHDVPGVPGVMQHAEDVAQFVNEDAVAGLGLPVAGAFVLSGNLANRGLIHEIADLFLDGGGGDFVPEDVTRDAGETRVDMGNGTGLSDCSGLGEDEGGAVAGVAGGLPDFLLLGIQEAIDIEGFSGVEGGGLLCPDEMDLESAILGELEVESPRPVPVCPHFPPVDVGHDPHEHFAFFPIARFHLAIGGNEVDQPDLVVLSQILEGRRDHEALSLIGIGRFFTVTLGHESQSEDKGEDHDGGEQGAGEEPHGRCS